MEVIWRKALKEKAMRATEMRIYYGPVGAVDKERDELYDVIVVGRKDGSDYRQELERQPRRRTKHTLYL